MRSLHYAEFPADHLRARDETVSVCVPAREEAATIAGVVAPLVALREAGVVDQVVVLDDDSLDGTGARRDGRLTGDPSVDGALPERPPLAELYALRAPLARRARATVGRAHAGEPRR